MNNKYLVTQPDLNAHGTLHGGILMKWVDEACGMQARIITGGVCATRHIECVDFWSSARLGDIVEIEVEYLYSGKTSITFRASVRNITQSKKIVALFKEVVFVAVDKNHQPRDHRNESSNFKPLHPERCSG